MAGSKTVSLALQKMLASKVRMRLEKDEFGESFAFAPRNESFAIGEGDLCSSMSGSKYMSLHICSLAYFVCFAKCMAMTLGSKEHCLGERMLNAPSQQFNTYNV